MIRFKNIEAAFQWVEKNAKGWCCVISSNQRIMVPPFFPRTNFRLLETEVNERGIASANVPPQKGIWI